jgi:hypothetical protein
MSHLCQNGVFTLHFLAKYGLEVIETVGFLELGSFEVMRLQVRPELFEQMLSWAHVGTGVRVMHLEVVARDMNQIGTIEIESAA